MNSFSQLARDYSIGGAGELIGTFILILLGNGVCASVNFKNMFAKKVGANWVAIILGWGFAVMCGVLVANTFKSGAHINPAVTIWDFMQSLAILKVENDKAILVALYFYKLIFYILMQFIGAMLAQVLLNYLNWNHIKENEATTLKASSCTGPSHEHDLGRSFSYELVGTLVLLGVIMAFGYGSNLYASPTYTGIASLGPLPVTFLVMAIGLSLGSVTGYAINPARDMAPRIIYALTIKTTKDKIMLQKEAPANFKYGLLVPTLAPVTAGIIMGLIGMTIKLVA